MILSPKHPLQTDVFAYFELDFVNLVVQQSALQTPIVDPETLAGSVALRKRVHAFHLLYYVAAMAPHQLMNIVFFETLTYEERHILVAAWVA